MSNSIQFAQGIKSLPLNFGRDASGVAKVENRFITVTETYSGKAGWKESALIEGCSSARSTACQENDIARKVFIFTSQPVGQPGADRGKSEVRFSTLHHQLSWMMVKLRRVHAFDHAEVICAGGQMREEVGEPHAGLPMLAKGSFASHERCTFLLEKGKTHLLKD